MSPITHSAKDLFPFSQRKKKKKLFIVRLASYIYIYVSKPPRPLTYYNNINEQQKTTFSEKKKCIYVYV
jgi:hypothetical protein